MEYLIGAVVVSALIFAITEFAKDKLGLEGNAVVVLVAVLGVVFAGLAVAITEGYIPPETATWIETVVQFLASILAAMGYYSYRKRMRGA
uniref:Holin n=1 Tax=viral metagenome TaxID=1070528 RepID=A0A6M3L3M1_9ZZZZ